MVTVTNLYRKGHQVLKNDFTENTSGTIHFFDAGTSSPQTVYSDAAGSSSLGTSVTLDSDGRTQTAIYISTTDVKVEHRDSSGNVIFPAEDDIPGAEEAVTGGYAKPETPTNVKNTSGTIEASDASEVFLCDATSADVTLTLVNSSNYGDGHPLTFIRTDNSSYKVTIESTGSESLNDSGDTSIVLWKQGHSVTLVPDGAGFHTRSEINRNNRLPMDYKAGCALSKEANQTANITAGEWRDTDNTYDIVLSSEITKSLASTWAAGDDAGGLDTSSVSANTLYYIHLIANPTTGVVDALFSTSKSSPTLPSGYTKNRVLGYLRTDGSSNIDWVRSYVKKVNGGPDLVLKYTASAGNNGGSALGTTWTTITLNSIEYNRLELSGTVLSSSVFTLPAGTYKVDWTSVCYGTNDYTTRLRNSSDSSVIGYAMNAYSTASSAHSESIGTEIVEITASKNFHIQYFVDVGTGGDGLGVARNIGGVEEIYNTVVVTRLDLED